MQLVEWSHLLIRGCQIKFRSGKWNLETKISCYQGWILKIEIKIWWLQKSFHDGCVGYILIG